MIEAYLKYYIIPAIPSIILCVLLASLFAAVRKISKESKIFDIIELAWIICTVITIIFTVSDIYYKDFQNFSDRLGDNMYQNRKDVSQASARFVIAYCSKFDGDDPNLSSKVDRLDAYCADIRLSSAESKTLSWPVANLFTNPSMTPYSNQPEIILVGGSSRIEQQVSQAWSDVKSIQADFNYNLSRYLEIKPYVENYPTIKSAQLIWLYFYATIIGFRLLKPTLQLSQKFSDGSKPRRKVDHVPVKPLVLDPNAPIVGDLPEFVKNHRARSD